MTNPANNSAERLAAHFRARGITARVRVGSAFARPPLSDTMVGPALYVHVRHADMVRMPIRVGEFEHYPVIYRIEPGLVSSQG